MGKHRQRWGVASAAVATGIVITATTWGIGAGTDPASASDGPAAATTSAVPSTGQVGDRDGDGILDRTDPEPDNPYSPGDQDRDGDVDVVDAQNEKDGGPGSSVQQAGGAGDRDGDGVSDYRDSDPDDPASPGDRDHDGDVDNNDAYLARHG